MAGSKYLLWLIDTLSEKAEPIAIVEYNAFPTIARAIDSHLTNTYRNTEFKVSKIVWDKEDKHLTVTFSERDMSITFHWETIVLRYFV